MKKVILLSNQPALIRYWVDSLPGGYIAESVTSETELTAHLSGIKSPLLMVDESSVLSMPELFARLDDRPGARLLLFHHQPDPHHAVQYLSRVYGYENSYLSRSALSGMLSAVENGNNWLFPALSHYLIRQIVPEGSVFAPKPPAFLETLTKKERIVAEHIARGLSNAEISETERIALSTVKGHIAKIFEKADVKDRLSLVLKMRQS
jgi:DNA-binding NarL/FixJ family response regulator